MSELHVDTHTIGRNAEVVASLLAGQGVALVGVTKGCLGEPAVGAAMVAGGAIGLADTRDSNLRRLRQALPGVELHRIYLPSATTTFERGDVTYVSSRAGAAAVAALPGGHGPRPVMLFLETGDLREGVPEPEWLQVAQMLAEDPRLMLTGVATNYACFLGAPAGLVASLAGVARAARELRAAGLAVGRVSGGNSSALAVLLAGQRLPEEITELRCGEALLLGQEPLLAQPIPGCECACILRAEVVEEYTKPSCGVQPQSSQHHRRLVLAIGRQDLGSGPVRFCATGLTEIGRSSDYLVVDAEPRSDVRGVGAMVDLIPSYEALAAAWTSPYVDVHLNSTGER